MVRREVADRPRWLYNEVQITDFQANASFALVASIMQGAVEFDQVREQLADGDPLCFDNR